MFIAPLGEYIEIRKSLTSILPYVSLVKTNTFSVEEFSKFGNDVTICLMPRQISLCSYINYCFKVFLFGKKINCARTYRLMYIADRHSH